MSTQDHRQCVVSPCRKDVGMLLLALAFGSVVACNSSDEQASGPGDEAEQATNTGGAQDVNTTGLPPAISGSPNVSAGDNSGTGGQPGASGDSQGSADGAGGTAVGDTGTEGAGGSGNGTDETTNVDTGLPPTSASSTSGGSPDGGLGAVGGVDSGTGGQPAANASSEDTAGGVEAGGAAFEGKELFILFGQSNMSGMSPMPDQPWPVNENVTFMVQYDCPSLGQTKDEWLPAEPPLHGCQWATGGIGLGLADHFGAALAEAWSEAEIGLIPNAIPAVTIDVFSKGGPSPGGGQKALPDGYTSAYTLMVDRTREAQKTGRVRAILLHQGESDFNQGLAEQWLDTLTTIISDLRTDLELGEEVPFIAGEIAPTSTWSGHNEYIRQIPDIIPNSFVVSSEGTDIHDVAHFDAQSARLMGQRYADTFLEHTNLQ